MRWLAHVASMGENRGVFRVLVRKPEGKKPFGRPRQRCEDNMKTNLQEVGCEGMDWITFKCSYEHLGSIKCGEFD